MRHRLIGKDRPSVTKMLFALCLVSAACMWLPAAITARGEETVTVRVGYYENEVFEEGAKEGAIKTGYAYEYYRKISEYTGWKYEYVYGDYSELYQMLLDGNVDLLAGLAWREERVDLIGYPDLPMGNETYNLVKHSSDDDITANPASFSGKTIGVLDSAMVQSLNQYLEKNEVEAAVNTYPDYSALFEAFDAGELDLLAAEGDGAYGRDNAEVLLPFGTSDYFMCVNKHRPDLLATLNDAQAALAAEEPNYLYFLRMTYYPSSISARAFSAVEKEWIESHDTLRIGYLENYLPYSGTDAQGKVTGIVKDIFQEMLKDLGLSGLKTVYTGYVSYDDMIADMSSETIDIAFPVGGGLYFSEENGLYQSLPVASASTELVHKGEFTEETTKHFAVNENNRMQYYFVLSNFPDSQITLYPSIDACLEAVLAGKVNCTTLNGLRANDILKNSKYKDLQLRQLVRNDDRCFGVEIGNEGLLKLLNRGINVVGSDYAQNISYRYTKALYSYNLMDMVVDHLLLFGLLFFGVAGVIILLLVRDSRRAKREMLEKERAAERLAEKNGELENSRRELEVQKEALKDALVLAERANQAKTVFLNNMSHDIRTPMNAIMGFTTLAKSHIDNKEQVKDYLGRISISGQHLLSLINDVLDMSRIESGKMTLEESEEHLPDLISDLQTIVQSDISAKQLNFNVDMQNVVHEDVVTDKLRLNQVLLNILSNAIKFTPSGGTISFHVEERKPSAANRADFEFRIKDTGIGMSKEFQKTIFDAFTREKTSTVSGIQGTGLGMAITRNILDMMGGSITVQSEEGKGSEFIVTLSFQIAGGSGKQESDRAAEKHGAQVREPKTHEPGVREPKAQADGASRQAEGAQKQAGNVLRQTRDAQKQPESASMHAGIATEQAEEETGGKQFDGKRVLLAEDNEMNQLIAETILTEAGLLVEIAGNGEIAVEKMKTAPAGYYDIVLMDIQMPKMDGYEAAKQIRNLPEPEKAKIPIVAVTANAFEEDRKIALEAGMNGHLAKPYDIPKIMETLKALLAVGSDPITEL